MTTAMTTHGGGLTAAAEQDAEREALIRKTVARDLSATEFELFMFQCRRTGLDPLSKQIHPVKRDGKLTIQTGIDGFRLVADRTGLYAGNDDPVFDSEEKPLKATVTVYKMVAGQRCPFTATARWSQYFPGEKQGFMWKKMPHLMLGKCAESLALRKAFPQDLSGVYTHEEMEQARDDAEDADFTTPPTVPPSEKARQARDAEQLADTLCAKLLLCRTPAEADEVIDPYRLRSKASALGDHLGRFQEAYRDAFARIRIDGKRDEVSRLVHDTGVSEAVFANECIKLGTTPVLAAMAEKDLDALATWLRSLPAEGSAD